MHSLIIAIINYLQNSGEDQETVEIIMYSLIIIILNYYKKLEKTKTVGEQNKGSFLLINIINF